MLRPQSKTRVVVQHLKQAHKPLTYSAVAIGLLISIVALWYVFSDSGTSTGYVFYTVKQTDLPIVVTERGNLESQVETEIICQVENVGVDRSGNYGTQIIFIVPNGSPVKKGDLLVELDSATIRDRLDEQELAHQKAVSARKQAVAKYENQLLQNKTTAAEAALAVELADLDLEMYNDPVNGTYQLAIEEIKREIDDAKNKSLESRSALELAKAELKGMEDLFVLGYRGRSDLDQSRLKFVQAEDQLSAAVNRVQTLQANLRKLADYERRMQVLTLEGTLETAKNAYKQVLNDNESLAEQALAARDEAEETEVKESERLQRLEQQLVNCKIYAPHDGMVVYDRDRRGNSDIAEGATVRERQEILSLPDLSKMQVKTQVHEAVLDQVDQGQRASIRVDAFPDKTYAATVEKVSVVPSSQGWFSGSVKTYDTVVTIDGTVKSLKPGMTAVVNIFVDRIEDVLAVPVQSVVQVENDNWCYVDDGGNLERRPIKIGRSNERFVVVREGLGAGDRVVLNPMDIMEERERTEKPISPEIGTPEDEASESQTASDDDPGSSTAEPV